jgi:coatomer subunit beta'
VRVFNYNTTERVKSFEAHQDYIRNMAVHPTLPYLLTSSDDMTIRLWDWDKDWACIQTFEGHSHYVMQVEFNPKDTNTFASASLDRTIKVRILTFGPAVVVELIVGFGWFFVWLTLNSQS